MTTVVLVTADAKLGKTSTLPFERRWPHSAAAATETQTATKK